MNNFKRLLSFLILTSFFITGCSSNASKIEVNQVSDDTFSSTQSEKTINNILQEEKTTLENNTKIKDSTLSSSEAATESTSDNSDITKKTKDYILKGQDDKSEAEQIKWSETFLNQVNIEDVYQDYLATGGIVDDIQSFAQYLTLKAPISEKWEELVAVDLLNTYDVKISYVEPLQDDLYQIYIKIDGSDVPYVVVNSRTGYFHG